MLVLLSVKKKLNKLTPLVQTFAFVTIIKERIIFMRKGNLMNSMVLEEGGEDTVVVEQGQVEMKMH